MFSQVVHIETIPIFLRQRIHLSTPRRHGQHFVLQDDAYNSFKLVPPLYERNGLKLLLDRISKQTTDKQFKTIPQSHVLPINE